MKNAFAALIFFISAVPTCFAQTIGEYVDLENQIVKKRLIEELNKPAQGSPMPSPAILPNQSGAAAPGAGIELPAGRQEKGGIPKTTAIYGLNDNGQAQYKSIVEWDGSNFEARPGAYIKGYRVESVDKSGTLLVRHGKGGASRIFAPSTFAIDGVK